jgi:predicted dehydrogenase
VGLLCHFVDSVAFLAGSPVIEVHVSGHGPQSRPVQAYDNLVVNLRFADSGVASVVHVASGSPRVPKERIEGFCGPRTAILERTRATGRRSWRSWKRHERDNPR